MGLHIVLPRSCVAPLRRSRLCAQPACRRDGCLQGRNRQIQRVDVRHMQASIFYIQCPRAQIHVEEPGLRIRRHVAFRQRAHAREGHNRLPSALQIVRCCRLACNFAGQSQNVICQMCWQGISPAIVFAEFPRFCGHGCFGLSDALRMARHPLAEAALGAFFTGGGGLQPLELPPFHEFPWRQVMHARISSPPPVQFGVLKVRTAVVLPPDLLPLLRSCVQLRQPLCANERNRWEAADAFCQGRHRNSKSPSTRCTTCL